MNLRKSQQEQTRRAILDAVAEVITETGLLDFSIQKVADRAGVTHRTVYNHFPTREALNDAFAVHVEEVLGEVGDAPDAPDMELAAMPSMIAEFVRMVAARESHVRAYAMLTLGSRAPAKVMRERSTRMERLLETEAGPLPAGAAPMVAAAMRMFISSVGWHVLTELHGLSNDQAARASAWAVQSMLNAMANGDVPTMDDEEDEHE